MYLCAWFGKKFDRVKIDDIGPDCKLEEFKKVVLKIINKNQEALEFIYCGRILNDDAKSLENYDIKDDSEIHVLEKTSSEKIQRTYTEDELRKISLGLIKLARVHNFHSIAYKVMKTRAASVIREQLNTVDSTAVAYLLHPELLLTLREPDTLRKIAEKHPSIIQGASFITDLIKAQTGQQSSADNSQHNPINSSSGDEEDMDSTADSSREFNYPNSDNELLNAITPAQLATALANAANAAAVAPANSSTSSNTSNIITNEMFSNALQQAFNSTTPSSTPPLTPAGGLDNLNYSSLVRRYESQLGQMHELGLTNDAVNVSALHTTSGNVQEAVELVLNGVID